MIFLQNVLMKFLIDFHWIKWVTQLKQIILLLWLMIKKRMMKNKTT